MTTSIANQTKTTKNVWKNNPEISFLQHKKTGKLDVLEVVQIFGNSVVEVKHFSRQQKFITIGSEMGKRIRFANKPLAWVPNILAKMSWCMYPFVETKTERKTDFMFPHEKSQDLFELKQTKTICYIDETWSGFVAQDGIKTSFRSLQKSGRMQPATDGYTISLAENDTIYIDTGKSKFIAKMVCKPQSITSAFGHNMDIPFIGLIAFIAALFTVIGVSIHKKGEVEVSALESFDRFAEVTRDIQIPPLPLEERIHIEEPIIDEIGGRKDVEKKPQKQPTKTKRGPKQKKNSASRNEGAVNDLMSDLEFEVEESGNMNHALAMASTNSNSFFASKPMRNRGIAGSSLLVGSKKQSKLQGANNIGNKISYDNDDTLAGERQRIKISSVKSETLIIGSLDRSLIEEVIKNNMRSIRYCYSRELQKDSTLSGKVSVRFIIGKDGSVAKASIKKSTLGSKAVENCIMSRFKRFKFAQPKKGGIVIVTYPIAFYTS